MAYAQSWLDPSLAEIGFTSVLGEVSRAQTALASPDPRRVLARHERWIGIWRCSAIGFGHGSVVCVIAVESFGLS